MGRGTSEVLQPPDSDDEQNGFKILEIDRVGRIPALAKSMVAVVQRFE
jgi:hypothetical protein